MGGRVQGAGFRVQGARCRFQGSGFRVQNSGFRVQGAGFRVQGSGFRVACRTSRGDICDEPLHHARPPSLQDLNPPWGEERRGVVDWQDMYPEVLRDRRVLPPAQRAAVV